MWRKRQNTDLPSVLREMQERRGNSYWVLKSKYEMESKIFRTGAAIYTAVVVAQRICPNRPNCEFRDLLLSFAATAGKHAKTMPPELWREQTWLLHNDNASSHTSSFTQQFLAKQKWLSYPTHLTPMIWHPEISTYYQKWNWSWKDAGLIPPRRSRPNRWKYLTHSLMMSYIYMELLVKPEI
jgi:hypothetical protein